MATAVAAPQPVLLNRKQAADSLGFSVRYIIRLEKQGILPPVRIGRCIRYKPADVEAASVILANSSK